MGGDEAELTGGRMVAAAGDDHVPEPVDRGTAAVPVEERKQRMAGPARAVRIERACIGRGGLLGPREGAGLRAGRAGRGEECAVRLLGRVAEVPLEAVQENRC